MDCLSWIPFSPFLLFNETPDYYCICSPYSVQTGLGWPEMACLLCFGIHVVCLA